MGTRHQRIYGDENKTEFNESSIEWQKRSNGVTVRSVCYGISHEVN